MKTNHIQAILLPYEGAINRDITLFKKWELRKVPTSLALKHFKLNNHVPEDYYISEIEFKAWLNSLGYIRS